MGGESMEGKKFDHLKYWIRGIEQRALQSRDELSHGPLMKASSRKITYFIDYCFSLEHC